MGVNLQDEKVAKQFTLNEIEDHLFSILSYYISNFQATDKDNNLLVMSLDSIVAAEAAMKVTETLGHHIAPTAFINHASLSALAKYIFSLLHPHTSIEPAIGVDARVSTGRAIMAENDASIIGVACRFPNEVDDLDALWKILKSGEDCCTETPLHDGTQMQSWRH